MKKLKWGAFVLLMALSMLLAGCAGGDDRNAMEVLEDVLEQGISNDFIHSKGSITVGWEDGEFDAGAIGTPLGMFGDLSEITVHYDVRQSTELGRTDATLSLRLNGMTLEAPIILTETDLYLKIPMLSNEFLHVPLETLEEDQHMDFDPQLMKEIILEFAYLWKNMINEEWLTLHDAEEYEGQLDPKELAFLIEFELTNERLQDLMDNLYNEQDQIKTFFQKVETLFPSEYNSEDISISQEDVNEAKEELKNEFDLEKFILQVVVDKEDNLREVNLDFSGKSLSSGAEDQASLRLHHTVISINEPFEFEHEIPEHARLLEDLFGGAF